MSGSYDKPGAPRRPASPHVYAAQPQYTVPAPPYAEHPQQPAYPPGAGHPHTGQSHPPGQLGTNDDEFYSDDPAAGAPTARHQSQQQQQPIQDPELVAHARDDTAAELHQTPIVPAGSVTGRSLTLVVSIMCFLACLTAGAVYMVNQSASAWLRDIASEVTVQIEPRDKVDMERTMRDISAFLTRQPGVVGVKPLSAAASAELLEPWLGNAEILKSLPVPRLIAVELDRNTPPDFTTLRAALTQQFPAASLDDHRQWQSQIRAVTRSMALGGVAILLLVAAATTAIIISATRSALASNREIVEVLHYVGATDRLIAREFERHFLRLGIKAGMVGAICAMLVFFTLPFVTQYLGGGMITQAEMTRLMGTGSLDARGYLLLIGLVVVIAALCMLTSRVGVKRILRAQG